MQFRFIKAGDTFINIDQITWVEVERKDENSVVKFGFATRGSRHFSGAVANSVLAQLRAASMRDLTDETES